MPAEQNWTKFLLNQLLDVYERSSYFRTGIYSRRLLYKASTADDLMRRMEDPDEKRNFLLILRELKERGILDYSWMKYEEGNIVEAIWLSPDESSIQAAYGMAGRRPMKSVLEKVEILLSENIEILLRQKEDTPLPRRESILHYLETQQTALVRKKKLPYIFTEDLDYDARLIRFLMLLSDNQDLQMERVISAKLYGDSKYFERQMKSRVVSILRRIRKERLNKTDSAELDGGTSESSGDELSDEDLLLEYGISRWPEIYELCGNLSVELDNGSVLSYENEKYGAYLNSDTVRHIRRVIAKGISNILFIENKANYVWVVRQLTDHSRMVYSDNRTERALAGIGNGLLVIYHGGCYSPMKGRLFRSIVLACPPTTSVWHWSDIDVGGFRIFLRLQSEIATGVRPFLMDLDTLREYESVAMPITSNQYLAILAEMHADDEYGIFHSLIEYMIQKKIRLEQENEID
ncbi:Wadjet anti-phage system protein JetD domain-containing protein [Lachnoclostridium sp. Marseille-P6806]|uniref:Wadjet anti-phage system protein JetD domain-containing protein n=1 Tax=Lachnoclostridium sp. Marseille-P6806 TaxID=2364793 RepID=UPI00102F3C9C|nr:Wadjet anti-phage system protein JetD domain-containing protein [Lachnoclostridium sp. Marseille-P6806]